MQIFTDYFPDMEPGYPVGELAPVDRILFIDIETTGLSREKTDLYLIGCGWFDKKGYNTIQWFADSADDEPALIEQFISFISGRFSLLIHYNGNHFDIPYLRYKAEKHGYPDPFGSIENYDIYAAIKPYKNILSLSSLRQREIEQLLDINSTDPYTGRDLISVYHRYVSNPAGELLGPLIFHNSEDLKGMAYILPVLYYTDICDLKLTYVSHEIHCFEDYHGNPRSELLIACRHNLHIPKSFKTSRGQAILSIRSDNTALLRLPVYTGTLKLFYGNYKDYYYLPNEDFCIHRSAASGVDPSRRKPATKETCYTKHSGIFIPLLCANRDAGARERRTLLRETSDPSENRSTGNRITVPRFRESYESKEFYIPYSEDTAEEQLKQLVEDLKL